MFRCLLLLSLSLAIFAGCGGGGPQVYPATGKMLYEGNPMPLGASVTFLPVGGSGVATSGMVDTEGNLTITTFEDQQGLVPGEYRVIVYQTIEKEPDQPDADGEIRPDLNDDFVAVEKELQIPKIYSDRAKSPLKITITETDNDLGTIDLKANPQS